MASQMQQYLDNLPKLAREHNGQIIAVSNGQLLGVYPSRLAALRDMQKKRLQEEEFVIVECDPNPDAYNVFWANGVF